MTKTLLTIAGFLLCIFAVLMFVPKPNKPIQLDRTSIIVDSMRNVALLEKIEISKALQASEAIIAKGLKAKIITKVVYREKLEERYVPDTTLCDTIVMCYKAENELLNQEAESYSRQLYECEKQNILKDTVILNNQLTQKTLNKEIATLSKKVKRNWIERNKGWIGFVGGFGTMYVISK